MASSTHTATVLCPPKSVFQFLTDAELVMELDDRYRVAGDDDFLSLGASWEEKRGRFGKRTAWEVTRFDKKGRTLTASQLQSKLPATITWSAKKGGTGSSNVSLTIDVEGGGKAAEKALAALQKDWAWRPEAIRNYLGE